MKRVQLTLRYKTLSKNNHFKIGIKLRPEVGRLLNYLLPAGTIVSSPLTRGEWLYEVKSRGVLMGIAL